MKGFVVYGGLDDGTYSPIADVENCIAFTTDEQSLELHLKSEKVDDFTGTIMLKFERDGHVV